MESIIDGKLHRTDGPAWYIETPELEEEAYYFHGIRHNLSGPAYKRVVKKNGIVLLSVTEYYVLNMLHTIDDNPSVHIQEYDSVGKLTRDTKMWYRYGNLHHHEHEAIKDIGTDFYREVHYDNGLKSNVTGPAEIITSPYVKLEAWYFRGKLHSTTGPALEYMYSTPNGNKYQKVFALYGSIVDDATVNL